ncbi:hypothetical protein GCM10010433_27820 [Streptomyces pulveraceus]
MIGTANRMVRMPGMVFFPLSVAGRELSIERPTVGQMPVVVRGGERNGRSMHPESVRGARVR